MWFYTQLYGDATTHLTLAQGSTPLTPLRCYHFGSEFFQVGTPPQTAGDQPRLDVTANKVSITQQISFNSATVTLVINKDDVLAGVSSPHTQSITHNENYWPARSVDPATTQLYLVTDTNPECFDIRVKVITGVPGHGDVSANNVNVTTPWNMCATPVPRPTDPSGTPLRDTSDLVAVVSNGSMWVVLTLPDGGLGFVQVRQLNPFFPNMYQGVRVASPFGVAACPTIGVTPAEDVLIGFSSMSSTHFLSAFATGRKHTDAYDRLRTPSLVKEGVGPTSGQVRMDYCGRGTFDVSGNTAVAIAEFQSGNNTVPMLIQANPVNF
jgi:hypothetical protein